jgi:hypothetical protein
VKLSDKVKSYLGQLDLLEDIFVSLSRKRQMPREKDEEDNSKAPAIARLSVALLF